MRRILVLSVASLLLLASCGSKDAADLIVGTWDAVTVMHQSTGHPDQSMNGVTTVNYGDGNEKMSMTFKDDGSGSTVNSKLFSDKIYVYDYVYDDELQRYVDTILVRVYDTTYWVDETANFSYFAAGNLLRIQQGGSATDYRIDQLDDRVLTFTDTNIYSDTYTNSYGRSIQFTQETKTVYNLQRR